MVERAKSHSLARRPVGIDCLGYFYSKSLGGAERSILAEASLPPCTILDKQFAGG